MPHATDPSAAGEPVASVDPDVSSTAPASTLGQTPHEPTVRPWELELLISGALVFGMLQLPDRVDAWYTHVSPGLDGGFSSAALLVSIYLKMALYAVIGGFVLHLGVRAYWVGVIGLEAVFPGGIIWEKTRSGPIMRDLQRRATPPLQALIDGADRLASLVFATGLMLAMLFCTSLLLIAVVSAVVYGTIGLVFGGEATAIAAEVFFFLLIGPMLIATVIDRRYGEHLDPGSRRARMVSAVGRATLRVTRYAVFQPLMLTILTNLRAPKRASILFMGLVIGGVLLAGRERLFEGRGMADGYTYLPDTAGRLGGEPGFYEDQRTDDLRTASLPSIQSDMVRDPYVRLFIPYRPRRHNLLVEGRCARGRAADSVAATPRPTTDEAEAAVLRCLSSLQPVTLNGRPVTAPFRFYTQPRTGIRGIAAYIPVGALPKGENVLSVARLSAPGAKPGAPPPQPPYIIPFWL